MILVEDTLYVATGGYFERKTFDDEKGAARAFNQLLTTYFHPREGWRIVSKQVGQAEPPPRERLMEFALAERARRESEEKNPLRGEHLFLDLDDSERDVAELEALLRGERGEYRSLYLYGQSGSRWDVPEALRFISEHPAHRLETLIIDTFDSDVSRQAQRRVGDLAFVLEKLPALERVFAVGQLELSGPVRHGALQHLSLLGDPLPQGVIAALAKSALPSLRVLDLGLSAERSVDEEAVSPLLPALLDALPPLERLALTGGLSAANALSALSTHAAKGPVRLLLLAQIASSEQFHAAARAYLERGERTRVLETDLGELDDEDVAALSACGAELVSASSPFLPGEAYDLRAFGRSV